MSHIVTGIEQRLEELSEGKAGKDEVVMSFDMRVSEGVAQSLHQTELNLCFSHL